jgi:hypothetical protein
LARRQIFIKQPSPKVFCFAAAASPGVYALQQFGNAGPDAVAQGAVDAVAVAVSSHSPQS